MRDCREITMETSKLLPQKRARVSTDDLLPIIPIVSICAHAPGCQVHDEMEGREYNCTGDMIFIFRCVSVSFQFCIIHIVLDLNIKKR